MLASDLLMGTSTIVIISASSGAAVVLSAILYGCLRKFSKVTWIGWEIFLLFGLTLLVSLLPVPQNGYGAFAMEFTLVTVIVGLVLAADICLRHICTDRPIPAGRGQTAWNRVFGAITALVTVIMFLLVVGGFALRAADEFTQSPLLDIGIWTGFYSKYAVDVFTVTVYFLIVRAGYRLGLLKGIFFLLGFALTTLSFYLSCKLCLDWDFLVMLSGKVGATFSYQEEFNNFLGYTVMVFVTFVVFFGLSMGLMALANWGIRVACTTDAVGITDACIAAVLAVAVFMGIFLAFSLCVQFLASGKIGDAVTGLGQMGGFGEAVADGFARSVTDTIQRFAEPLNRFLGSSPVFGVMHGQNFIWLLIK